MDRGTIACEEPRVARLGGGGPPLGWRTPTGGRRVITAVPQWTAHAARTGAPAAPVNGHPLPFADMSNTQTHRPH